jgi:magnesium transporter
MKGDFNPEILKTSFVISLSLGITLNISNLAGALIPLIISRFKIDPATASGPLITTINDIFSVTIYFTLATLLLKG